MSSNFLEADFLGSIAGPIQEPQPGSDQDGKPERI